ncbi:M15 family metallopeptidase [Nocardioides sp. URHA0020]|uniref:M15 family metallopeptidase n=1 Tax=Nocardioides sp. URHA0020 TaxID=1380392 RepID=UPI0012DEDFAB|nr:M15 family metallopeptidase [Nocardioides sp. URHA0020]
MSLGTRLCVVVCALALATGMMTAAGAATTSRLSLTASKAFADNDSTVRVALTDETGAPVVGASVVIERRRKGSWTPVGTLVTGADGRASTAVTVSRTAADNRVRASYAGDADHPPVQAERQVPMVLRTGRVSLVAPKTVVDEHSVRLRVRWAASNGQRVAGKVRVYRRVAGGSWLAYAVVATGRNGLGSLKVTPRKDTSWQVRAPRLDWVTAARSAVRRIDNLPPGRPVRLPKAAPSPRIKLPVQRHAVGRGAHVSITGLSDAVWRQMVGVSWHSGCPVGRGGLRIIRVNYWDYQGYRRRGEVVASTGAAGAMGAALAEMYRRKLPIRAMYRVDRFGWSDRSHGGNDYASMAAGNTSAFNCRDVTGRPGHRSPHSWGRSLDVNTWENPYRSAQGLVPNSWWQSHSDKRVAWRSRSHAVVKVMARHGLRWTYGNGDTQHFDFVGKGSARSAAGGPEACTRFCD